MKKIRTVLFIALCTFFLGTASSVLGFNGNYPIEGGVVINAFDLMAEEPELINLIYRVDPYLRVCKDPLEIAKRLLPIVSDLTITTGGNFENVTKIDHHQNTAQEYYRRVIRKYKMVRCGGRNTFLSKILNEYFDVPAFNLNMGEVDGPHTHVVAIVPIRNYFGNRYFLFDAHFGGYFTDLAGNLLDLESIFQGKEFILKYISFRQKIYVDPCQYFPGKPYELSFERPLNDAIEIYSFVADEANKTRNYSYENCSWRDTLILHYLDMGVVLSDPKSLGEFYFMLLRNKIGFKK